ncbi:hypothetical protein [Pararhodobacter sp. SW119]|uniref:hypothetical protein n=1 Tax=Pararhodobacter sp. SW119 TaxID=2780075 RepID=UPI001AE0534D|nr:hypothetical protein [Pararhodobacter sp. SW119]
MTAPDRPAADRPTPDPDDPKGLIRESYRIEGISAAECRSILVDWALSLPAGADPQAAMARLLDRYGMEAGDHPMSRLLGVGAQTPSAQPSRRGGRAGRMARDG